MKSVRKEFDKELYKTNVPLARAAGKLVVEAYIRTATGGKPFDTLIENPNKYGPDLIGYKGNNVELYVECEVKHNWTGLKFPYLDIQVPERKRKSLQSGLPAVVVVLSHDLTQAAIIQGNDVLSSPTQGVANKYIDSGQERFFKVPCDKAVFVPVPKQGE
jgi:hypothetical protein